MSLVVPPYPPARYTKDDPEVSAWLRRAPENGGAPPDFDSFGLVKYHYLANQQATNGDYGRHPHRDLAEGRRTGPALPPRHVRVLRVVRNDQAL